MGIQAFFTSKVNQNQDRRLSFGTNRLSFASQIGLNHPYIIGDAVVRQLWQAQLIHKSLS